MKLGRPSRRNNGKNHGVQNAQRHLLVSRKNTGRQNFLSSWPSKKSSTFALNSPKETLTTILPSTPVLASPPFLSPVKRQDTSPNFPVTKHSSPVGGHGSPINALYKIHYLRLRPGQPPHHQTPPTTTT